MALHAEGVWPSAWGVAWGVEFGLGLRVRANLSVKRLRLEHLPTLAVERSGLGV